jgi:hypothetical protein
VSILLPLAIVVSTYANSDAIGEVTNNFRRILGTSSRPQIVSTELFREPAIDSHSVGTDRGGKYVPECKKGSNNLVDAN